MEVREMYARTFKCGVCGETVYFLVYGTTESRYTRTLCACGMQDSTQDPRHFTANIVKRIY